MTADLCGPAVALRDHDVLARIALAAAAAALIASAMVVARTVADFVVFAITLPLFVLPGVPVARWYAGPNSDRLSRVTLGVLFGFIAGALTFCLLRVAGISSPLVVLAACVALAAALRRVTRDRRIGVVRLTPLTSGDAVALGCLMLLVAVVVGPVFARVGIDTPQGKAYRAYFIADLFGFMSVVAELIKGHLPPLNPFNAGEPLPYYWTYFTYPAVFASLHGGRVPLERGILLTQIVSAATLVSVWYVVLRNVGRSVVASASACGLVLVASSFEGFAFMAWSVMHQRPISAFRNVNIDGLTRWWWNLPPVDGMHRALWYTPQHATAFTCGFVLLATLVRARDANAIGRRVADGLLLGGAFLFSSFTGILLVVWYAATEILLLIRVRGRDVSRWAISCLAAAAVVLAAVGLAFVLSMVQAIPGAMVVHLDRYLLKGPSKFVGLSFGPLLLIALAGVRRLVREQPALAVALAVLVTVCAAALIGLEAPGHDNTYLPLRTGNFFFLALLVAVAFALDELRSWRFSRQIAGIAAAVVIAVAAVPTAALDWYNARDITNTAMNPGGFPWTVHLTPSEQLAMRWMRERLPADAVIQPDSRVRGRATWALIPAFGQRRMAAGVVLYEPNPARLNQNLAKIDRIFREQDLAAAHEACLGLGIDYLYVGDVEAAIEEDETAKFDRDGTRFRRMYSLRDVRIYQVLRP